MNNMVSRRWFLGGAASSALFGFGCELIPNGSYKGGKPNLVFGVVSDIHVRLKLGGEKMLESNNTDIFLKALKWFEANKVDAVCIPGDLADSGLRSELKCVADAWYSVFPNDRAADGRKVEKVFVYGNHDWNGPRRGKRVFPDDEKRLADSLCNHTEEFWRELFHEEWSPVYLKKIKGYNFVGAHWCVGDCKARDEAPHRGLEEFYAAHADELKGSKPFFHIQHPHPKGTCHGDAVWGQDDGLSTRILSKFPNAVAFSGHSHTPLTDEMSVWQGAFTSIGCASLRYLDTFIGLGDPQGVGPENCYGHGKTPNSIKSCPTLNATPDLREGMLVKVYDDAIVITRRNLPDNTNLGYDWYIPLPVKDEKPFDFAAQRERAKRRLPRLSPDAAIAVHLGSGKMRGFEGKKVSCSVCEFVLPAAQYGDARTHQYDIEVLDATGKPLMKPMYALPNDFASGPDSKRYNTKFPFSVSRTRIPNGGKVTFKVTPRSRWGTLGPSIESSITMSAMPDDKLPKRGICAHRGDMAHFPEDTIPAIVSAAKKGAQMVEIDAHRCKTGEFVVMHDGSVDRTTNGHGKIADLTFDYIRSLDAGSKFSKKFAGEKVPTLEEALSCLPKSGIWINVHCKDSASAVAAAKEIRRQGRLRQAFIAASLGALAKARAEVPEVMGCNMTRTAPGHREWTEGETKKYCEQAVASDCCLVQLLRPCKASDLAQLKNYGGKVNYFHAKDEHHVTPDMLKGLFDMGVDFVLCNDIDPMLEELKKFS